MDLRFLAPIYERPAPYVSVYLDTGRATARAIQEVPLRWRAAKEELARQGVDGPLLGTMEEIVTDPGEAAPGRALFAADGKVVYSEALPAPPVRPIEHVGRAPRVMPLLMERRERLPHVRVLVDREGADIAATGRNPLTVDGQKWPVHQSGQGGWSQSAYGRSTENTWANNAELAAHTAEREAEKAGAELIVLGGDVQARRMVLEGLGPKWFDRTVEVYEGSRAAGADLSVWENAVEETVRAWAERRLRERLDGFGKHPVEGFQPVAAALQRGQVDTLLVNGEPEGELWIGDEGQMIAATEEEARTLGFTNPQAVPAGDALVRAVVASDASLEFVPESERRFRDGVGVFLRFVIHAAQ
ncbi:Vms1/Ankzf1 family peptidyl-tRNA hydrolase [Bailinhaonella thermotolerans]|uniref:Peptide chain release factor 1 n=1 Tax=Bailinhaonella thermotolerans TaxID=1070861 RepID=A0A3A4AT52_9ACTN|nr:Vms1/Ankzf1 family peptidyl-tRNA hydrolase [Bailinhaonella thermotolerans]RJL22742.1 hypothetical protein D5H75_34685 [Bailinhaonella thermotolerans]